MSLKTATLANGLRVITDRNEAVETAAIGLWVDVGTRHEPAAINGVAHLLEHMAFKGTATRSARGIAEEIEAVGGHLNAYTSREQTAYYARVLKPDVPLALDILGDILTHSVFDETELDRERQVILQEIGQAEDTPDDIIFDHLQEAAYPDQSLGRPVLGRAEIIETLPRAELARYFTDHYGPSRMVLSAAGAVDHEAILAAADRLFQNAPPLAPAATEPARYQGGDRREERDLEQTHLVLGFPGVAFTDPDYYAANVLSSLLGGGMSSRLFQEIREQRGLVYSIYSFSQSYADGGLFGVYAGTGEDEVSELIPVLCDELNKVRESVTEPELARARATLKSSLLMGLEGSSARAEHQASQLLIHGDLIPAAELVRRIEAVDAAALTRVARRLFQAAPSLAALGPVGRIEPYDRLARRLNA